MKETVEVFAICYNEENMLPHFIKHYKDKFNAKITILDNQSTDHSAKIAEDLDCIVVEYDSKNQIRDDIYLNIKNNYWKDSKADWVIVCDIDEFLEVDFDVSKYTIINTDGFDIVGDINSRMGVYNPMMSKHIMFRPNHFKEIGYKPGCHRCLPVLNPGGQLQGSKEKAKLLHRKYISEEILFKKHCLYEQRLSSVNKTYGWGVHYQNTTLDSIKKKFDELRKKATLV